MSCFNLSKNEILLPGTQARIFYAVEKGIDKIMNVVSGSEGGLEHAEKCSSFLQDNGIPALALGYFKTKHTGKTLERMPLEIIESAIQWLNLHGKASVPLFFKYGY